MKCINRIGIQIFNINFKLLLTISFSIGKSLINYYKLKKTIGLFFEFLLNIKLFIEIS